MASDRSEHPQWGARLHVVTGKGGTGKTTVAAALAMALAQHGKRVLVVEVEGRQGLARHFGRERLSYQEEVVATGAGGGQVFGLAVDPRAAIVEYVTTYYRAGPGARLLEKAGAVDFATSIAPGLRDVLTTGKVYEATRRGVEDGDPAYHAVVLDAPPTGRVGNFLNVTAEVTGLARVGPIHQQARSVMKLLRSPQTAVHVVTLLEDMPVQETLDAIDELTALGLPLGSVLLNLVRSDRLDPAVRADALAGRLDEVRVRQALALAGLPEVLSTGEDLVVGLLDEAAEYAQHLDFQDAYRRRLAATGRPLVDLPHRPDEPPLGRLTALAQILVPQPGTDLP